MYYKIWRGFLMLLISECLIFFFLNLGQVPSEPIRHDLFELDRKRKLLLDEVENIQKKKLEELETLKRIEARKEGLLKELAKTQETIEKQKMFMNQLEKDIIGKSLR